MRTLQQCSLSVAACIAQVIGVSNVTSAEPCALVRDALMVASSTTAKGASPIQSSIDAGLAYACLQSVPLDKKNATAVVDGLAAFWTFHSTQAWLKDPPPAYPVPGVDLLDGLTHIRAGVVDGTIYGEYQFQAAIQELINQGADGHFTYKMDLLNVFTFDHRAIGPVVAVSDDGVSLPLSYYTFGDLQTTPAENRSSIVSVNGQPAAQYFDSIRSTALYADPDAQLAYVFGDVARMDLSQPYNGMFADGRAGLYFGNVTTLLFANGSQHTYQNLASTTHDFHDIDSGLAFYRKICSPSDQTAQLLEYFQGQESQESTPAPAVIRPHYPPSQYMDESGTIAGYFLNGSHSDTVVLSILEFATGAEPTIDAQSTLQVFLAACRTASIRRLIIDVSSNNGGNSLLPFDFFKQLFPTVTPYNVQNARAHAGYELLGSVVSTQAARFQSSGNITQYKQNGGFSSFDVADFTAPDASTISWPELYGPQQYHADNFTNLFGRRYFQPNYTEMAGNLIVSGYGSRSDLAPQAFESEDILLVSNGACDSACALFVHFLQYQGKVKQLALGGRPQEGPMQAVGGTRGTQVETFSDIFGYTYGVYSRATADIMTDLNKTELVTILETGAYLLARATDFGSATLNFYNHIAQNDTSLTPLQFTYSAADCRLFYTAETAVNVTASWAAAADAWKSGFSRCIAGSTNQPSSLSGNAQLYNGGNIANVSASEIPANGPSSNLGGNATGQVPHTSAGSRATASWTFALLLASGLTAIIVD